MVIDDYNLQYYEDESLTYVHTMVATLSFLKQIQESQWRDRELLDIWHRIEHGEEK